MHASVVMRAAPHLASLRLAILKSTRAAHSSCSVLDVYGRNDPDATEH